MMTRALLGGVALIVALVAGALIVLDDEPRVDPYLPFMTAHLEVLPTQPPVVSADAKFSRSVAKYTDLDSVDPALDACAGPVAVYLGDHRPLLVAEHDYCGGSAWMPRLRANDVVQLTGRGVEPGLYTTVAVKHVPRYDSKLKDLPEGDVVLQTCISRKTMVLVALRWAAPVGA
jgi:hypothetical protein